MKLAGNRSLRLSRRGEESHWSFLDHNTHVCSFIYNISFSILFIYFNLFHPFELVKKLQLQHDNTAGDKSGWKSGNWKVAYNANGVETFNCSINNGFKKKVDRENWVVNEGEWEINGDGCKLSNKNHIEAFERTVENSAASSTRSNSDDIGSRKNTKFVRNILLHFFFLFLISLCN